MSPPSMRPMRPVVRTLFEEEVLPVFRPDETGRERLHDPSSSSLQHWIELRYLHSDNTPVQGAAYHVRSASGSFSFDGVLDSDGFVRISGVPSSSDCGAFTYWFDKDPQPYKPRGPALASSGDSVKRNALSALESTGDWLWGTVQGDFNKEASLSQIGVNLLLGLVPLVDQTLDLRDLVAGTTAVLAFYSQDEHEKAQQKRTPGLLGLSGETWLWLNLFLIGLGCVPGVGSVVKGVFKGLIRFLQDAASKSGARHSPAQQKRLWETLLRILNYLGLKPGNAHRFLKQMQSQLSGWMDQAAGTIKAVLAVIGAMIGNAEEAARRLGYVPLGSARSREVLAHLRKRRAALAKAYNRMEQMKWELNHWLWEQLRFAVGGAGSNGGKHVFEAAGSLNTPAPAGKAGGGSANVRKQEQEAPPEVLMLRHAAHYHDLRERAVRRAVELKAALSNDKRGPILTVLKDTKTGQIFERINAEDPPPDLHPILSKRLAVFNKKYPTQNDRPHPSFPGSHSEIYAINDALKAREAAGMKVTEDDLKDFVLYNETLYRNHTGPKPCCSNCSTGLTDDVESLTGKNTERFER